MTKKEIIETLKRHKQRIIDWSNRMIEEYGENAISDEIKAMNAKEIAGLDELIAELEATGKTEKRKEASKRATEARSQRAKEKIQNAINLLRMEGKDITAYSISKVSGVHYTTVKKYLNAEEIKK